jgi:hypothetical protein
MYKDVPPSGADAANDDRATRESGGTPLRPRRHLQLIESTDTASDSPAQIVAGSTRYTVQTPQPGSAETWDEMVRHSLAAQRSIERLRDAFQVDYRGWAPGTTLDLAVLNDRAALAMLRQFLRKMKKAAATPPSVAYRSGQQVVKQPPRAIARKVRCWELQTGYSWILLLPSGEIALQAHPDEFSKIVTDDGREPVVIAGINAPRPYGLSAEDVAAFVLDACRMAGVDW